MKAMHSLEGEDRYRLCNLRVMEIKVKKAAW